MPCLCAPAGQEEFFALLGQPVATRTEAPASLEGDAVAAFRSRVAGLAAAYRTRPYVRTLPYRYDLVATMPFTG